MPESGQNVQPPFAEYLEAQLRARSMSGGEAARRLGVSRSQISRWRMGEGGISLESLEKVAAVFGTDIAILKRLTGFHDRSGRSVEDDSATIDPGIAAVLDAERQELHAELSDIPQGFWPAILEARRVTTRTVADIARQAHAINARLGAVTTESEPSDQEPARPKTPDQPILYALSRAALPV